MIWHTTIVSLKNKIDNNNNIEQSADEKETSFWLQLPSAELSTINNNNGVVKK